MTLDEFKEAYPEPFEFLCKEASQYGLKEECLTTLFYFIKDKDKILQPWVEVNDSLYEWDI